jgi:hypothetical protein
VVTPLLIRERGHITSLVFLSTTENTGSVLCICSLSKKTRAAARQSDV